MIRPPQAQRVTIIAHRGVHNSRTDENTIASFERALDDDGIHGVECDVRYSKDKQLVIAHDDDLDFGGQGDTYVSKMAANQLAEEYSIPTLESVFKLFENNSQKTIVIDYKTQDRTLDAIKQAEEWAAQYKCNIMHLVWQDHYDFVREYEPRHPVYFAPGGNQSRDINCDGLQRKGYTGVSLNYGDRRVDQVLKSDHLMVNLYGQHSQRQAMLAQAVQDPGRFIITVDIPVPPQPQLNFL